MHTYKYIYKTKQPSQTLQISHTIKKLPHTIKLALHQQSPGRILKLAHSLATG